MSAEQATSSPVPEVRAGAASAAAANDNDPLTWTKTDESRWRGESCPNGLKTRDTGTCNRESEAPNRIPIASKAPGKYSKTDVLGVRCEDASCSNLETDTDCATARSLQRAPRIGRAPPPPPPDDPAARPMVAGSSGGFTGGVLAPSPVNSANSRGGARQPQRQRKGKPPCPISVARNSVPVMVGHAHGPLSRIRIARIPSYHPNHGAYETMMQHLWPARAASLIFDAPEGSLPVCHKHTSPMPRPTTASAATAAPEQRALARFVAAWIQAVVASRASPRRRRPHHCPDREGAASWSTGHTGIWGFR